MLNVQRNAARIRRGAILQHVVVYREYAAPFVAILFFLRVKIDVNSRHGAAYQFHPSVDYICVRSLRRDLKFCLETQLARINEQLAINIFSRR